MILVKSHFKNSILWSVYFFLIILFGNSFANDMQFEHLTVENGLSNSTVYSILQDKTGYLWFGTPNGLNKYDGYQVTVFKNIPGDSTSLASNNAGNVYLAKDGKIWIGSWGGGVDVFNPLTNKAEHFSHDPKDSKSISDNRVQTIFEDSKGNMWLGTFNGGLNRFYPGDGHFKRYQYEADNPQSISNNRIWAIAENYDGKLWIGTSMGLNLFDPENGESEHFYYNAASKNSLNHNTVRALLMTKDSVLWIGTTVGFSRLNPKTMRFKRFLYLSGKKFQFNNHTITCFTEAQDGEIWIGAGEGIYILNPLTNSLRHVVSDPIKSGSLGDDEIRCIFQDRSGIFWIGTKNKGISKFNPNKKNFYNFYSRNPGEYRLKQTELNALTGGVYKDRYYIFFVNIYGFYRFEPAKDELKFFSFKTIDSGYHQGNFMRSVSMDPYEKNIVWLASEGGLYRYNIENDHFSIWGLPGIFITGIGFSKITYILPFKDKLWLGEYQGGLVRFDKHSKRVEQYFKHIPGDTTSLSHNEIYFLQVADSTGLWIGTGTALDHYSFTSNKFTHLKFNEGTGSHDRRFFCMYRQTEDTTWLGTEDGLLRYLPKTGAYHLFTMKDGLPDNMVSSIEMDDKGRLWLGTDRGLSRFDPRALKFHNFDITDGLSNSEYLPNSVNKTKNSTLYFGGKQGLDYFDPKTIHTSQYNPQVVLTDFQVFNKSIVSGEKSVLKNTIDATEEVRLPYNDYLFSIEFAALDYGNTSKIKYAYKLDNFDTDWLFATSDRRFASYMHLPGGTYTLRVKATNEDGIWSNKVKSLSIVIVPAFWNTLWFRVLSVVFILAVIFFAFRVRLRVISKRNRALSEINVKLNEQMEMREIAEHDKSVLQKQLLHSQKMEAIGLLAGGIAHDFNNLLTAIIGNIGLAQMSITVDSQIEKILLAAEKACMRAKNLTEQLLTFSKGGQPIREASLLQDVVRESSQFVLTGTNVKCEIDYVDDLWLADIDKGQISQVVQNLVINAQQAMPAGGRILIVMRNVDASEHKRLDLHGEHYIEMEVRDEGHGIEKKNLESIFTPYYSTKKEGSGLGLAVTYSVIEKHHGHIRVESSPDEGTTFRIYLPASAERLEAVTMEPKSTKVASGRILVMDDQRAIREVAKAMLESLGYVVDLAKDGEKAIELYREALGTANKYDVVIMDLTVPGGMGGKEAVHELRKIDPNVKAVVSSGYSNDPIMANYKDFGFYGIMSKPYTLSEMGRSIQDALRNGSEI